MSLMFAVNKIIDIYLYLYILSFVAVDFHGCNTILINVILVGNILGRLFATSRTFLPGML